MAPDLGRARRLVARSGTGRATVTVLGVSDDAFPPGAVSRVAARALTQLGYRVRLRMMTRADLERLPVTEQRSFSVSPFAWYADFPSPATFFQTILLSHAAVTDGRICEPPLDREIAAAVSEEATRPDRNDARWTAVDRHATQLALTVQLVNPRSVELTSSRVHGYQYNALWGFLAAQARLH